MKIFLQTTLQNKNHVSYIYVGSEHILQKHENSKNVKFKWEDVVFVFLYEIILLYIFVLKECPQLGGIHIFRISQEANVKIIKNIQMALYSWVEQHIYKY